VALTVPVAQLLLLGDAPRLGVDAELTVGFTHCKLGVTAVEAEAVVLGVRLEDRVAEALAWPLLLARWEELALVLGVTDRLAVAEKVRVRVPQGEGLRLTVTQVLGLVDRVALPQEEGLAELLGVPEPAAPPPWLSAPPEEEGVVEAQRVGV